MASKYLPVTNTTFSGNIADITDFKIKQQRFVQRKIDVITGFLAKQIDHFNISLSKLGGDYDKPHSGYRIEVINIKGKIILDSKNEYEFLKSIDGKIKGFDRLEPHEIDKLNDILSNDKKLVKYLGMTDFSLFLNEKINNAFVRFLIYLGILSASLLLMFLLIRSF